MFLKDYERKRLLERGRLGLVKLHFHAPWVPLHERINCPPPSLADVSDSEEEEEEVSGCASFISPQI